LGRRAIERDTYFVGKKDLLRTKTSKNKLTKPRKQKPGCMGAVYKRGRHSGSQAGAHLKWE